MLFWKKHMDSSLGSLLDSSTCHAMIMSCGAQYLMLAEVDHVLEIKKCTLCTGKQLTMNHGGAQYVMLAGVERE